MKTRRNIFFILALIITLLSCRRGEISISQVIAQPYVYSNGNMAMSVFVHASLPDKKNAQVVITDPSGTLSWNPNAEYTKYENLEYIGCSSIALPDGDKIPQGRWTIELIYKDGRTVKEAFNVEYKNIEQILESHCSDKDISFDPVSNLTYIP